MSKKYKYCNIYGGACKKESDPILKVSETLVLEIDISSDITMSCIQIIRTNGISPEIINILYGKEAEQIYDILKGDKDK